MILTANDKHRFLAYVFNKSSDECWEWLGAIVGGYGGGYGQFGLNRKTYRAHRIAYYLEYGINPGKLCVCHKCDNRSCVNPSHLLLGTQSDNIQDAGNKGHMARDQRGEKSNSVKLTEENVIEIKRLLNLGISPTVIAKRFPVKRDAIYAISAGRTWK